MRQGLEHPDGVVSCTDAIQHVSPFFVSSNMPSLSDLPTEILMEIVSYYLQLIHGVPTGDRFMRDNPGPRFTVEDDPQHCFAVLKWVYCRSGVFEEMSRSCTRLEELGG